MKSYLKDPVDFVQLQRALVVKFRHLGDVLLTSPVFSALKYHAPHMTIDALIYADTEAMLREHSDIEQIHTVDRTWKLQSWRDRYQHERKLMAELRSNHYDLIINLTENNRAAWLTRLLKPKVSVSQAYPHRKGHWWRRSFTHIYHISPNPRHTVEVHLDALRRLGMKIEPEQKKLHLGISNTARESIRKKCEESGLVDDKFFVIHPASRWMFKNWNAAGFAQLIDALSETGSIVITSGPAQAEQDLVNSIVRKTNGTIINLAGQLDLYEFAALLEMSSCFVGVDSVPMHMAAALSVPAVVLFGPSNEYLWGPWMCDHRIVTETVSCRPCGLDGCGNSKISDCLQMISPQKVITAVQELLSST